MPNYNISIVDKNLLFAELLCHYVKTQLEIEASVITEDYKSFLHNLVYKKHNKIKDIILLHVEMADSELVYTIAEFMRLNVETTIILITKDISPKLNYVIKDNHKLSVILQSESASDLLNALSMVKSGEQALPQEYYTIPKLISNVDDNNAKTNILSKFTAREREVLFWLSHGLNNKEIASTMFISEKTVKNHINHIFKKLETSERSKAIVSAWENGLAYISEDFFMPKTL